MAPAWSINALTGIAIMVAFWLGYRILHKGSAPTDAANARALALTVTRFGAIVYAALTPDSSTFDATATGLPSPGMGFTVEFWPIFLALALLAVAAAFRYSASLQRDTQGLV